MFDIPFLADWNKIGEYRQCQTDQNTEWEICSRHDWDYKVGDLVLVIKDGILHKGESKYERDSWTITSFIQMAPSGFNAEQHWSD